MDTIVEFYDTDMSVWCVVVVLCVGMVCMLILHVHEGIMGSKGNNTGYMSYHEEDVKYGIPEVTHVIRDTKSKDEPLADMLSALSTGIDIADNVNQGV